MTKQIMFSLAVAIAALLAATSAAARDDANHEQMVVALKTDDVDLTETDISDLAVGDAKTVYTEDGRTIDILRTEDGVEIYVDGELIDMGLAEGLAALDGSHIVITKEIEVNCDTDEDCDELTWNRHGDEDADVSHDQDHDEKVIVIKRGADSD